MLSAQLVGIAVLSTLEMVAGALLTTVLTVSGLYVFAAATAFLLLGGVMGLLLVVRFVLRLRARERK